MWLWVGALYVAVLFLQSFVLLSYVIGIGHIHLPENYA